MIEIITFGGFQVIIDGSRYNIRNRKTQALLTFLALNSGQIHDRLALVDLFWPDLSEKAGLNNLSKSLSQMHNAFGQAAGVPSPFEADRLSLRMVASPAWQLDALRFVELVEEAESSSAPQQSASLYEQAVAFYQGEFLAGLALKNCPSFEAWFLLQQESMMLKARECYQRLAAYHLEQGGFKVAQDYAREQLVLDPWHEEAHRQLMLALAGLGQRSAALSQFETCRAILRSELGLEPDPATKELYERIKAGLNLSRPPEQRVVTVWAARLPRRLAPLIGRTEEIDLLLSDLAEPGFPLVTITGTGGVGKTSLALEAARRASCQFHDGACFVALERLQVSKGMDLQERLASEIGAALEFSFAGSVPIYRQLVRRLRERELLLILDNFEHLMGRADDYHSSPVAFLTILLEQAPKIKVLVTSREQLGIPSERLLALEGLPYPEPDIDLTAISDYSSVRLFVEQARRNQRHFRLTTANTSAIATICRLVEGLPLGIELAARWVNHFSCDEIAAAIQEDWDFMVAERFQSRARHQSLHATFSYSWRMLAESEREMLASLSIIAGQFSRSTALSITAGELGDLVRLQGKSLLRQEGPGYYSLHYLLRQFSAGKLNEQPAKAQQALRRRFANYFLNELAEQGVGFNRSWSGEAIRAIATNIENIRRAWQMALDMDSFDLLDKALQPLYHYYRIQGLFHEALRLFNHTADTIRASHNRAKDDRLLGELLGRTILRQGRLTWFLADTRQAVLLFQDGLKYLQQAQTQRDLARGHAYLAEALFRAGRSKEADRLLEKTLALYRQEGDEHGVATTLELQAVCASQAGNYEEADRLYGESIAISRRTGNRRLKGRSLHDWGLILLKQGKFEQSADRFRRSQVIARELNLHMPIAFNQSMLARTDRHLSHYDRAHQRLEESLQVLEGSGYAFYAVRALNMQGEIAAIQRQTGEAKRLLDKALTRLNDLQPADSQIFTDLALDFLVAAAFLFTRTSRETHAFQIINLVQSHVAPETDLGQRLRQLLLELTDVYPQSSEFEPIPGEKSLAELLREFRL